MSSGSKIEWTNATWNPVTGCTRVSAGCDNCYAVQQSHRMAGMGHESKYGGLTVLNPAGRRHFNGVVRCHEDTLQIPLHWRKPRRIFVNSMSDLFHRDVPFDFIDKVFAVMALCPQHTFQILTKRPERMAAYLGSHDVGARWAFAIDEMDRIMPSPEDAVAWTRRGLRNVWLGTSCEDQPSADERIPHLLKCPAAVRFLSLEPLLGPITARWQVWHHKATGESYREYLDRRGGVNEHESLKGIQWIILGCESKPGKAIGRHRDEVNGWMIDIVAQAKAAGVPVYVKQISLHGKASGEPSILWPEQLRVREWPRGAEG
jgi:protein gp37